MAKNGLFMLLKNFQILFLIGISWKNVHNEQKKWICLNMKFTVAQRWHAYVFIYLVRTRYLSHSHEILCRAHQLLSQHWYSPIKIQCIWYDAIHIYGKKYGTVVSNFWAVSAILWLKAITIGDEKGPDRNGSAFSGRNVS